jgi:hypothetical protein
MYVKINAQGLGIMGKNPKMYVNTKVVTLFLKIQPNKWYLKKQQVQIIIDKLKFLGDLGSSKP